MLASAPFYWQRGSPDGRFEPCAEAPQDCHTLKQNRAKAFPLIFPELR